MCEFQCNTSLFNEVGYMVDVRYYGRFASTVTVRTCAYTESDAIPAQCSDRKVKCLVETLVDDSFVLVGIVGEDADQELV